MLTKQQKYEQVKQAADAIKSSDSLLFADFTKVAVGNLNFLRRLLKNEGARLLVIKKRLLKIALREAGLPEMDAIQFGEQAGMIFIPKDVLSVAGVVYKFGQEMAAAKKIFRILGGYDRSGEKIVTVEEFITLAKLPSRETLLAQIAIMLMMPVRQLAWALKGREELLSQPKN